MEIDNLTFSDKELPMERIIQLIREEKILKATIKFSGDANDLWYDVSGEIDMATLFKNACKK